MQQRWKIVRLWPKGRKVWQEEVRGGPLPHPCSVERHGEEGQTFQWVWLKGTFHSPAPNPHSKNALFTTLKAFTMGG